MPVLEIRESVIHIHENLNNSYKTEQVEADGGRNHLKWRNSLPSELEQGFTQTLAIWTNILAPPPPSLVKYKEAEMLSGLWNDWAVQKKVISLRNQSIWALRTSYSLKENTLEITAGFFLKSCFQMKDMIIIFKRSKWSRDLKVRSCRKLNQWWWWF